MADEPTNKCIRMLEQFTALMPTGVHRRWLDLGQVCKLSPIDDAEREYIDGILQAFGGPEQFRTKQCYFNAQSLFLYDRTCGGRKLTYWEGWWNDDAIPIPTHHAWLTLNGKVFDPTRDTLLRKVAGDGHRHYFGVPVKLSAVRKYQLRYKAAVGITDVSDGIAEVLFGLRPERERTNFMLRHTSPAPAEGNS